MITLILALVLSLEIEPLFVPGDNVTQRIADEIRKAEKTVKVQSYPFTDLAITTAMIAARKKGVDVYLVADKKAASQPSSRVEECRVAGIGVRLDGKHAIHHNKIVIVDDKTVITGSFNFSLNAQQRNAENIVIITGVPKIAKAYRENWQQHWEHSEPLQPQVNP
jgi:phosphatidylserine/phosphatidylglycerophosphate/cardiolipin synthase-like enzyme